MNIKKTAVITAIAGVVLGASFAAAQVTTTSSCYQFNTNLRVGNTGADVKALQQTLNANGFTVAAAGHAGSAGMETSYFGNATKNALIKWQEANAAATLAPWGLTSGTGFFGATSRAEMNKCAPGTPTTPGTGTVSGAVSVSLASVQPNTVLVQKSSHAKLADFVFSGTGIVTGVKLQRTGVSNNSALTNVYLYEGNVRISDAASVLADGTVNFNYGTGLFSVTGSKVISVYADIADNTSGQSVGVSLIGHTTAGNPAAVVAGVNGPNLPIASATLVGVTIDSAPSSQGNVDVGNTNVNVWSTTINNNRDAYLEGANLKMIGSAPTTALSNVKLYIDGVQVGNAVSVDTQGRIAFAGTTFLRAGAHTLNVRADIADGAGRDFYVVLEQGSDLLFRDAQLSAYAMPTYLANQVFNLQAPKVTITSCTSGCAILSADTSFSGQKATAGASNQTIGKYTLTVYGEPVKLVSGNVDVQGVSTTSSISNISVYVNGTAVTSGLSDTLASTTGAFLSNLGGFVVNPGSPVTIEVKADIRDTNGNNLPAGDLTVYLKNVQVQGTQSRNTQTIAERMSNSVNVGSLFASFTNNAGFTGSNSPSNAQSVKIGSYTMSTGATEGVRLTQIDVTLTPALGFDISSLSNVRLMENGNQVTFKGTVGSGTGPITTSFSLYQDVSANSSKTYDIVADLANASGTLAVTAKANYQGMVGMTSTTSVLTAAVTTTVAQPGVSEISLVGSQSKVAQYVVGGTSPFAVASFNVKATGSNFDANTVEVVLSNPAIVTAVTIDGVTATKGVGDRYTASLSRSISTLGTTIPVTVTFAKADQYNNFSASSTTVGISYIAGNNGVATGTQYTGAALASSNAMTLVASMPTAVKGAGQYLGTGSATGIKVGTIKVDVSTAGDIVLNSLPVAVGLPSGTFSNLELRINNVAVPNATASGTVVTFTGGYRITAGSSVTFDVYGDVASVITGGNTSINAGAGADFDWSDLIATGLKGTLLTNYGN